MPDRPSGTIGAEVSRDVEQTFLRAEQTGLRLAIIGRTLALLLLGVWLVGSRADGPVRMSNDLIALSGFAALGLAHYALIGSRYDRPWLKYVFVLLDIAVVSALVATRPLYASAADLIIDIERRFARRLLNLLNLFSAAVSRTVCYMNSGNSQELVFEQQGAVRNVHHQPHYRHLSTDAAALSSSPAARGLYLGG